MVDSQRNVQGRVRLPHPLHLIELLTGSRHYHCGFFVEPDDSLDSALDRMVIESTRPLLHAATVLDVGCAMGGSSVMLAAKGIRVVGIDPCPGAISYARRTLTDESAVFLQTRLEDLDRERPVPVFDAAMMLETLQHFRDLRVPLQTCFRHLRPGGTMVVSDMFLVPSLEWERAPFHRPGALIDAAVEVGFTVSECRDVTGNVVPSYPRLVNQLEEDRAMIEVQLAGYRPNPARDVDELLVLLQNLGTGFENGDLKYEITVLERPDVSR